MNIDLRRCIRCKEGYDIDTGKELCPKCRGVEDVDFGVTKDEVDWK